MSPSATEAAAAPDRDPSPAGGGRAPRRRLGWMRRRREQVVYATAAGFWRVGDDSPAASATLDEQLDAVAGADRLRLIVAAAMLHQLVVRDPELPLTSELDLARYARLQFAAVHGPQAERWPLASWSEWPLQVASALHGLDLEGLQSALLDRGVCLRSVTPSWTTAWSAAHQADREWSAFARRALLWVEGGLAPTAAGPASGARPMPWATWITADRRGLCSLRQRRLARGDIQAAGGLADLLAQEDAIDAGGVLIAGFGLAGEPALPVHRVACGLCRPLPEARWLRG